MKACREGGDKAPHIFRPFTRSKEVINFMFRPLFFEESALDTHWIGGWVSSLSGLDLVAKRKIPILQKREHGSPSS
jgi:hypothetical protein